MSNPAQRTDLSPEDEALAQVLAKSLASPQDETRVIHIVSDFERLVSGPTTDEARATLIADLEKIALDETPGNELRKALSGAWIARAKDTIARHAGETAEAVQHNKRVFQAVGTYAGHRVLGGYRGALVGEKVGQALGVATAPQAVGGHFGRKIGMHVAGERGADVGQAAGVVAAAVGTAEAAKYAGQKVAGAMSPSHRKKNGKGHHKQGRY